MLKGQLLPKDQRNVKRGGSESELRLSKAKSEMPPNIGDLSNS